MKLIRHNKFKKQYKKLPQVLKDKTDATLKAFVKNPFNKTLGNHALRGSLIGKRAISITGDLRIVFEEYDDYTVVLMLAIGTHAQVY